MFGLNVKYWLLFCCYFLLHYVEGLPPIGGLSIAQLWKIPVLCFLLSYNILSLWKKYCFEKIGYILSFEYLFSPEILVRPVDVGIRISKQLPFILFFGYWRQAFVGRKETLEKILYGLAQFVCLSAIPTLLDIVHPIRGFANAESFGVKGLTYFSGVFGAPHAAASYFCAAVLVLINGLVLDKFKTKQSKCYNLSLVLVGLIALFRAYVRTGWLMLGVGLLCFVEFREMTRKRLIIYVSLIIGIVGGVIYLYHTNEAFYARLTGRNIYTGSGGQNVELGGSGRTVFWYNAVENLWNADNVYYSLFGRGYSKVVEDNLRSTGMKVFSHNQFFDALAQNGLFGLLLLVSFYVWLWNFIRGRDGGYKRLCNALLGSAFVFSFFQNEMFFDFAVLFSIAVALLELEVKEKRLVVKPIV